MKELNPIQNLIFRCGALAFVLGLGIRLFEPFVGLVVYVAGILAFTTMQMLARYDGSNFVISRLRRQQILSDFAFLGSACSIVAQDYAFGPEWLHNNTWVMLLVIGSVLQLYTAFRIPQEVEKENEKKHGDNTAMLLFLPFLMMQSCASQQFNVEGTTNLSSMEGRTLYLKVFNNNDMSCLDSCVVQHGRIHFTGVLDSAQMCSVYLENENVLPIVLEEGVINLVINDYKLNVTGSPMNDTLYNFIRTKTRMENEINELWAQKEILLSGKCAELNEACERAINENDEFVTSFILNNSDNVLGPGVFMILTRNFPFPQYTPQIEEIVGKAKPYFRSHPYVRYYIKEAEKNLVRIKQ